MSAVHFSFTPLLNERCRDLFQSDCFLFSKSDVGVMEPYNDDRWNHDLFESHKPVKATHCFQTKAKWSAWEQDETNYTGVEANPLPSPAHLLQPNPHRWCLMKKAFSCLRLSTPSNIEVAKDVINVRQSGQDAPSSLDFTVRGTTGNVSRDFVVSSKKKIKKNPIHASVCLCVCERAQPCPYFSRRCALRAYAALISACQMQNEYCYGWGICSGPQWAARRV